MARTATSAKSSSSIRRWQRLPVPVRRAVIGARHLTHPGHQAAPSVTVEMVGAVAVVRFDDGKVNALSHRATYLLLEALDRVKADESIAAVVLTGRPGQFGAGFDLDTLMIGGADRDELIRKGWELLRGWYRLPLPLVIACTGNAVAAGAALLLTGDVRLGAAGEFKIGFNEAALGLPLPGTVLMLCADRLNPDALEQATTGARMHSPDEAVAAGFLHRALPASELLPAAISEAQRLSELTEFRHQKQARIAEMSTRIDAQLQEDLALIDRIGAS
jgi:enoyl-CoA hydratase